MCLIMVQEAFSDSQELLGRLRSIDAKTDSLIAKARQVEKSIETMREHNDALDSLSNSYIKSSESQSNNNNIDQAYIIQQPCQDNQSEALQSAGSQLSSRTASRSTIVSNLQRESRHFRKLERENHELRMALEDHQNTLELIMSKYRSQVSQLIAANSIAAPNANHSTNAVDVHRPCNCTQLFSSNHLIQMYQRKVNDMAAVMMRSIELDEAKDAKKSAQLAQLTVENKGLREMLTIALGRNSTALASQSTGKPTVTQSTQTKSDDLQSDLLTTPYILTSALDSMSISSGSTSGESSSHSPNSLHFHPTEPSSSLQNGDHRMQSSEMIDQRHNNDSLPSNSDESDLNETVND